MFDLGWFVRPDKYKIIVLNNNLHFFKYQVTYYKYLWSIISTLYRFKLEFNWRGHPELLMRF